MSKSLVGIYETPEKTVTAVEELTTKGYSPSDISVVTRNKEISLLEDNTNAEIHSTGETEDIKPASFLDKIKNFMTDSNEEPEEFEEELQSGKYLVFIDSNEVPNSTNGENLNFDNNEVDVMPSQTMNTTFERKKLK